MKWIVTNNFDNKYSSKEEAEKAYEEELSKLEGLEKGAFKFMYTVAPFYEN